MTRFLFSQMLVYCCLALPVVAQGVDLPSEISEITVRIEDAQSSASGADTVIARKIAQQRLEILKLNKVLLENRQLAMDSGVQPNVVLPSVAPDLTRSAEIQVSIETQRSTIQKVQSDARAQQGLARELALLRLEAEKLTLTQLRQAWFQAHYGIPFAPLAPQTLAQFPMSNENKQGPEAGNPPKWADPNYPDINYDSAIFETLMSEGFLIAGWYGVFEAAAESGKHAQVRAINFSQFNSTDPETSKRLLFQCSNGVPLVMFHVGRKIPNEDARSDIQVTYRIDGSDEINSIWARFASNQAIGLTGDASDELIVKLAQSRTLTIRAIDLTGHVYEATFDMRGSDKAAKAVGIACGRTSRWLSVDILKLVQTNLTNQGFDPGLVDGIWDDASQIAMSEFQIAQGREPTGRPDKASLNALGVEY